MAIHEKLSQTYGAKKALHTGLRFGERLVLLVFNFPFDYAFAVLTDFANVERVQHFYFRSLIVQIVFECRAVFMFLWPRAICTSALCAHFGIFDAL